MFDSIICIGQFDDDNIRPGHELVTKLTKQQVRISFRSSDQACCLTHVQVCIDLGAKLLIDDSLENALSCVSHDPPTPILLFGDYEWNKRQSFPSDHKSDDTTFSRRLEREGPEFWKKDEEKVIYPEDAPLWRVKDWGETIRWVEKARQQGRI